MSERREEPTAWREQHTHSAFAESGESNPRPPTPEEWSRFIAKLKLARTVQVSAARAVSLPDDLHADFAAVWCAFEAVLELLVDQPDIASDELAHPLVQLGFALGDVQGGHPSPLFRPHKRTDTDSKKGAPCTAELALRACAAMAMDALVRAGAERQNAALQVARTIEAARIPVNVRSGATLAATVNNWRNTLTTGKGAPAPSLRIWGAYKRNPQRHGATPQERADKFLRELRENEAFRFV
jgi:hypothetical protein